MSDLKFTMSEVTFRLLQLLVFDLNLGEGKSDENDDSDFETLLHFETIETYCYCSRVISVSNKRTKKKNFKLRIFSHSPNFYHKRLIPLVN